MKKLTFALVAVLGFSLSSCGGGGLADRAAAKICECASQTDDSKKMNCMKEFGEKFKPEADKLDEAKKKELENQIDELVKKKCPDAMDLK